MPVGWPIAPEAGNTVGRDTFEFAVTYDTRIFYDQLAPDYDAIFVDWDAAVRRQGRLIASLIADIEGPVLDISCGMGTQAIGLALEGRAVVGRDLSRALIERAKAEAGRLGAEVRFEEGDMRVERPEDAGKFGVVISFDNALPHSSEDAELLGALRAARAALRDGGRFLASIRDYDALLESRPVMDPPRVLGRRPHRRIVMQLWQWATDDEHYDLEHLLLREHEGEWTTTTRRATYRVLRRDILSGLAREAGFTSVRWILPEDSAFHQPVMIAQG